MANEISKLITPDGVSHDIKDSVARNNISNLATVASTGEYSDLLHPPTVAEIDDNSTASNKAWSAYKITSDLAGKANLKHTHDPIVCDDIDIPEGAANLSTTATAHKVTVYRNGLTIPYKADNTNDGGMLRVRGATESDCILELGTWDDSGSGETIQFNYYPTTSQVTPTYSVSVPKKSGTIALTTDIPDVSGKVNKSGDTMSGNLTVAQGNSSVVCCKSTGADASKANNNVSSTAYPAWYVSDTGNRILTRVEAVIESSGNIGAYWYVRNYNTSGSQVGQKGIKMTMNKSGTLTYAVDDSANFRSAIGANVALSTTDVSYTRSHASVGLEFKCWRYGNVVTIGGYFSCQATIAANTVLYSNFPKPKYIMYFTCKHEGNATMYAFNMNTSGQFKTNQQIVSGNYLITMTYVCT